MAKALDDRWLHSYDDLPNGMMALRLAVKILAILQQTVNLFLYLFFFKNNG